MTPKMKVTSADGTSKIVEDETWKNTRIVPRYNRYQPRTNTIETILAALRLSDGQTLEQLANSTNIPDYYLPKFLQELEKEKKVARSGPRHFLLETTPSPEKPVL